MARTSGTIICSECDAIIAYSCNDGDETGAIADALNGHNLTHHPRSTYSIEDLYTKETLPASKLSSATPNSKGQR